MQFAAPYGGLIYWPPGHKFYTMLGITIIFTNTLAYFGRFNRSRPNAVKLTYEN
jgi:hypothetical protein